MVLNKDRPAIYAGLENSEVVPDRFAAGTICLYTARCPDKQGPNQDAIAVIECGLDAGVLVVADGLGGVPAGERASAIAVETLYQAVTEGYASGLSVRESVLDGIEQANRTILDTTAGSATTVIAIEISDLTVRSYHVGDSQALIVGQRGKIKYQTIAHSPVGYAVESGMLHEDDAMHHDDRHIISNVVGSNEMRVDLGPPVKLARRDTLVIGSDGLFDNMSTDEITAVIRCGRLEQSAMQLISIVDARMRNFTEGVLHKPDDLSFILYRPA